MVALGITFSDCGVCEVRKTISRQDDSAGAPTWRGRLRATGGHLCALGRTRSRLERAPHRQLRTEIRWLSRAYVEPDVLMPDRIPALRADHAADVGASTSCRFARPMPGSRTRTRRRRR